MNPKLLVDAIVQQTTVLIAQLSTATGVRSPLAHVADQVFLSLAQEIERQGVSRKVTADMFGLALRTYQRKVQRLSEGSSTGRTLWESVLEFVGAEGPVRRDRIVERFAGDDPVAILAVLADLGATGFVYSLGRGDSTTYGVASDADRRALGGDDAAEALATVLWGMVFRESGVSTTELVARARWNDGDVRTALDRLLRDGRVRREGDGDDAPLRSAPFLIPEGAAAGWEAAVFDHFQAVSSAIAAKISQLASGSQKDPVGGTTLHFGVYEGHPHRDEVYGLLARLRGELMELWKKVVSYNEAHPKSEDDVTQVTFYFGQNVIHPRDATDVEPASSAGEVE
ncbi:MAG TPA: hypothetical protein VHE30_06420 [Polyangiaceae bacterium]|nr:hypothetical protein [Polyangiaceae bacterium]